jgi:hypothetical protein
MNRWKFGVALAAAAAFAPAGRADGPTCGYGTKIDFVDTPKEAAALARKQEKLGLVLHVSGHFEDPRFT